MNNQTAAGREDQITGLDVPAQTPIIQQSEVSASKKDALVIFSSKIIQSVESNKTNRLWEPK